MHPTLGSVNQSAKSELLQAIVRRIIIAPGQLNIEIDGNRLSALLTEAETAKTMEVTTLTAPFEFRRRGVEARLIIKVSKPSVGGKGPMLID